MKQIYSIKKKENYNVEYTDGCLLDKYLFWLNYRNNVDFDSWQVANGQQYSKTWTNVHALIILFDL